MVEADAWRWMKVEETIVDPAKGVAIVEVFFPHERTLFPDQHAPGNKKRGEGGRFKLCCQRFDKILAPSGRLATVSADFGRGRKFKEIAVKLAYSVFGQAGTALYGLGSRLMPDHPDRKVEALSLPEVSFFGNFHGFYLKCSFLTILGR